MLADLASQPDDAVLLWHGGIPLPAPATLGAVVGELVFHGHDVARAVDVAWPIERRDALPIVDFFCAATPYVVDAEAARGVVRTFEIRVRGHDTFTFAFRDGVLAVTPGRAERPDVRVSADPVAFLLVGYRRAGLVRPILTGKLLAWGRRPWLALGFADLFQTP